MAPREGIIPVKPSDQQGAMCPSTLALLTKEELVRLIKHTNRCIVKLKEEGKRKDLLIRALSASA